MVFLVAAKFAESYDIDGVPAGLLALMSFFIVTPFTYSEAGTMVGYPTTWFGATGLFTAFIIALVVSKIYTTFITKGWVIKMPAGVPPTVSKSFSGLIPGFTVAIMACIIRFLTSLTSVGNIHTLIFKFVSTPLTTLGGSFVAMLIAIMAVHILWLFGVHGTMVVVSIFAAIWAPLDNVNLAAYNAGQPIPNIVSMSLFGVVCSLVYCLV